MMPELKPTIAEAFRQSGATYALVHENGRNFIEMHFDRIPEGFTKEQLEAYCYSIVAKTMGGLN